MNRMLIRVDPVTGANLAAATLPSGLLVSDLAVDPMGRDLYVSAAHLVRGGMEGTVMLSYDARSGRGLVTRTGGLIRYSVAGAQLTAVPGGVWASFRTGMLGLTIHLRQKDLGMIAAPGSGIASRPATGVFHWPCTRRPATAAVRCGWPTRSESSRASTRAQAGSERANE